MIGARKLRVAVVAAGVATVVGSSTPAPAFWRIWQRLEPKRPPVVMPLAQVRNAVCGRSDAVQVFGENAFMRREAERAALPDEVVRAIAAAYMAETNNMAETMLSPHLNAPEGIVRDAARISYAFVVLRRTGASNGDGDTGRVAAVLREPFTTPLEADRQYLLAVLALAERDWRRVAFASQAALKLSGKYYNAHVLHTLAQLAMIGADGLLPSRCEATLEKIENLLLPLLSLGACPMHVGHMELAAERYLAPATDTAAQKLRIIRRVYLAYVSQNDKVGKGLIADYRKMYGSDGCIDPLAARLDFDAPAQ